jgi:phytoene dehydrogenase-like protein
MNNPDVIIIGGGLGGLVAGAKLSKEGKKVLVVEQHSIPGGCATNFKRVGSSMDVGLHEIGGIEESDISHEIFKELKIFENIEFLKLPEFYRFTNSRLDIVIPDNNKDAEKMLIEKFPEEEKGIRKFFKEIMGYRNELNRMPRRGLKLYLQVPFFPLLYPRIVSTMSETVSRFMDKLIKNNDLKLALTANIGYYHDDPETMAYSYFAIAQAGYYSGGYYIKGGSQKLSDYLVTIIKKNNGEVLLRHKVNKILTENNKAVGIEYKKTTGESESVKIYSEKIIANAAIPNVLNDLLPKELSASMQKKTDTMEIACSLLSIYFFFKKPIRELGNTHYSTFVFNPEVHDLHEFDPHVDFKDRGFVFVDYSQIDSQLAAPGKGVGAICTVDYLDDWNRLSKAEYKAKKDEVAKIYIERLDRLFPGIKDQIEYYEVGTPKTIERYTLNPKGTPYGFAQIPGQTSIKRIPNKSPIKNLYFASAWTMPGGGFTGAILSGWHCAEEILK